MRRLLILLFLSIIYIQTTFCFGWSSPKREVRAVWLTTIGGLDWPHIKAHDSKSIVLQQQELCSILDKLKAANFNTIVLQTRIRSTVIYPSRIEPWDDCLTGYIDRSPGYDPLKFAIDECHKRGMELHAWIVAFPGNSFHIASMLGEKALQRRVTNLCLKTSDFWMLDPGVPKTADYLSNICKEIVQNYDIDGINLDYVRYPEKSVKYNDMQTYLRYGHRQNKANWRRENVTRCVNAVYSIVKALKPWVRVSCSPVGKYTDLQRFSSHGWNSFTSVYQDAQGWMKKGIMDMLMPMMYFHSDNNFFPFLFDWEENTEGRIFCGGLAAYKLANDQENWNLDEIEEQMNALRFTGGCGQAFFRSHYVTENEKGLYNFLINTFYTSPALTPALTWQRSYKPQTPQNVKLETLPNGFNIEWSPGTDSCKTYLTYNIYCSRTFPVNTNKAENLLICKQLDTKLFLPLLIFKTFLPYYAITTMDRYGNESEPVAINLPPTTIDSTITIGSIVLNNDHKILSLPNCKAEFLLITDATENIIEIKPFTKQINISDLPIGLYSLRTLSSKGKSIYLGKFFKKQ